MEKVHTSKVKASYSLIDKILYLDTNKIDLLPSYLYYVCEDLEHKDKIDIEFVVFNTGNEKFKTKDLKGKRDWSEVKCVKES